MILQILCVFLLTHGQFLFIAHNSQLRASLTTLVRLLKDAVSAVEVPLGKAPVGDREGKRIRELCQALLQVGLISTCLLDNVFVTEFFLAKTTCADICEGLGWQHSGL